MALLLGEILRRAAAVVPDRPATIFRDGDRREVVTFGQLDVRANRFAHVLMAHGVEHGDRVAVLMFNNTEWGAVFFGALKRGAVAVPVNARFRVDEVIAQLRACRPRALVVDAANAAILPQIGAAIPELRLVTVYGTPEHEALLEQASPTEPGCPVAETDPHVIFYTSGTTGTPKGALHSHRDYVIQTAQPVMSARGTGEDDVGLVAFPWFHMSGWALSLTFWRNRATVVLLARAAPEEIVRAIEEERCTQFYAIPEMLRSVVQLPTSARRDLSSLVDLDSGTSAMSRDDVEAACGAFGVDGIRIHYGSSEAGPCTILPAEESRRRPSSIGRPPIGVDVRLIDPTTGDDAAPGEAGELVVRNDYLLSAYFENPDETARALRDGWYHTGDLATADDDGFLYICGRIKEVIRSGGESIFPTELERVILELDGVLEASVVGIPDERWGEAALAAVIVDPAMADRVTADAVIEHCAARLASYKKPRHVMFVDELPKAGATQKVQKALVRQRFEEIQAEAGAQHAG
jgi:fatty-acyl-CoA synthase